MAFSKALVVLLMVLPIVYSYNRRFTPDRELSSFVTRLWNMDTNRCQPGRDYAIDLQGYVTDARNIRQDYARRPFFSYFNEDRVFTRPTFIAFRRLLDNYETETGRAEQVTKAEDAENKHFIDVIMETNVMKETHAFLVKKRKAPATVREFKWMLYGLWFKLYKRKRTDRYLDSSGFEHVFVGETRGHEVTGFHNWVQLYLQEKRGHVDYRGYFRRGTGSEDNPRLVTIQFKWTKGQAKPIGSFFIGTSPEFEMAVYTMVHLLGGSGKKDIKIGNYNVQMNVHGHGKGIGSAYPVAM